MRTAPGTAPAFVPLPRWQPDRRYWATVGHCMVWGPLLGGLPINVFLLPIPLSYLVGGLPALIGGMFYALWRHAPGLRTPGRGERMLFGALCGGAGLTVAMSIFFGPPLQQQNSFGLFLICAVLGGALTPLTEGNGLLKPAGPAKARFKRTI